MCPHVTRVSYSNRHTRSRFKYETHTTQVLNIRVHIENDTSRQGLTHPHLTCELSCYLLLYLLLTTCVIPAVLQPDCRYRNQDSAAATALRLPHLPGRGGCRIGTTLE